LKTAAVIIDNSNRSFDKIYHYEVPLYLEDKLVTGVRINVPFGRGNSLRLAYFLDFVEKKEKYKLKQIINIVDKQSSVSKDMFRLAKKIRDKYFCTYSQALNIILPAGAKIKKQKYVIIENKKIKFEKYIKENKNIDISKLNVIEEQYKVINSKIKKHARLAIKTQEAIEYLENMEFNNEKQMKVIELLIEYEDISVSDFLNFEGISRSTINTLNKKGFITVFDKKVEREIDEINDLDEFIPENLSELQKNAIYTIYPSMKKNISDSFLIKGITGSGKTEVYLNLAEKAIKMGKQVIVLVPEISLTPMMIRRFMGRFKNNVAVLHSRLSVSKRYDQWKKIKENKVSIALGVRSCIFAPFSNLGLIIVDESHETSYKSETTPKYNAIDIANMRSEIEKAVLVLGSATPNVSTYYNFKKNNKVITMDERVTKKDLPNVSIIDMREELKNNNKSIFGQKLKEQIQLNLANKEQTLLFLNRRGYSSFYMCRDCGKSVKCDSCDISLTHHKKRNLLICHYCGQVKQIPNICPNCKSKNILSFGIGTEKIEEQVKKQFKDASVIRMDFDTTGMKNSHMQILDKFKNDKIDILIGTQMIAKGHDFPNITLVGIIAADSLTKGFNIYSEERAFQLITQSVGRAGRGEKEGRAIIQAYDVDNVAIVNGVNQDYYGFYEYELKIREILKYPPFGIIGKIIISGEEKNLVEKWAIKSEEVLNTMDMEVSKAVKAPIGRIKNKYRYRIIVKGYKDSDILKKLKAFYKYIYKKLPNNIKCSIDIDGIDMI